MLWWSGKKKDGSQSRDGPEPFQNSQLPSSSLNASSSVSRAHEASEQSSKKKKQHSDAVSQRDGSRMTSSNDDVSVSGNDLSHNDMGTNNADLLGRRTSPGATSPATSFRGTSPRPSISPTNIFGEDEPSLLEQEALRTKNTILAQKSLPLVYNKVRHDILGQGAPLAWSGDPTISLSSTNFLPPVAPTEKAYHKVLSRKRRVEAIERDAIFTNINDSQNSQQQLNQARSYNFGAQQPNGSYSSDMYPNEQQHGGIDGTSSHNRLSVAERYKQLTDEVTSQDPFYQSHFTRHRKRSRSRSSSHAMIDPTSSSTASLTSSSSSALIASNSNNNYMSFDLPLSEHRFSQLQYFRLHRAHLNDMLKPSNVVVRGQWRLLNRMKTVSAALVVCLNIGTDPPDVVRTLPCARKECWVEPLSMHRRKALQLIGETLERQYQRWQPRARYKQALDPTVQDIRKICASLRRTSSAAGNSKSSGDHNRHYHRNSSQYSHQSNQNRQHSYAQNHRHSHRGGDRRENRSNQHYNNQHNSRQRQHAGANGTNGGGGPVQQQQHGRTAAAYHNNRQGQGRGNHPNDQNNRNYSRD
eukprot:g2242.t1